MLYLAYQQLKTSEHDAYQQSLANVNTASNLISAQIEAAISKLYLLEDTTSVSKFDNTAQRILKHNPVYSDIIYVNNVTGQYRSMKLKPTNSEKNAHIQWSKLSKLSNQLAVSSLYEKKPGQWVFAVRYTPTQEHQIWIEFDLMHTTQSLRGLRTLTDGYVFVIDRNTGRLIFHADPNRIGTPSVSFHGGISELISHGSLFGDHEYYYRDQYKVSVYDADNPFNWVFISGTDRSDILQDSYQFSLAALVIASLLVIAIGFKYLSQRFNQSIRELSQQETLTDYKQHLRFILDQFCDHKGVQFCLYDNNHGHFSTIDFHGNTHVVLTDKNLAAQFEPNIIKNVSSRGADTLAKKLQITSRHYAIPLFDKSELIGVVYMQVSYSTFKSILHLIRNYAEISLANLILNQSLRSQDVMTHLDNKLTIRGEIDNHLGHTNVFFALIDIDHFKRINDTHSHLCGDLVILKTAEMMEKCFKKPKAISLARYGGEEFCVLFHATDEHDAYEQCDIFRQVIDHANMNFSGRDVHFTVSIGVTNVKESQHVTIGAADKALYQAKGLGRNQVVLNTFRF
ncbi:GGDEF domain-containing protein [Vibrio sinensis]|uniref:diguanylate cyclase n=2 Tax=Vibrio sinensis TaxID=2302434 RepID=A0A3A6Q567_9VIBR|nr:GGDEF domain-containing protein [Vibrio sinensis]